MITDAELVRKMVSIYAEEGQDIYPTKIQFKQLCKLLPGHHRDEIIFHLNGCVQAGLIEAVILRSKSITDRPGYHVASITGLTPIHGSEFYLNSKNEKWWKECLDRCLNEGSRIITIIRLLKYLGGSSILM